MATPMTEQIVATMGMTMFLSLSSSSSASLHSSPAFGFVCFAGGRGSSNTEKSGSKPMIIL